MLSLKWYLFIAVIFVGFVANKSTNMQLSAISDEKPEFSLQPIPLIPKSDQVTIHGRNGASTVLADLKFRIQGSSEWLPHPQKINLAPMQFFDWNLQGLESGTRYEFIVSLSIEGRLKDLGVSQGSFVTQRKEASPFKVALFTDSHIGPFRDANKRMDTLENISAEAAKHQPDLVFALGDNVGWPHSKRKVGSAQKTMTAYEMYRLSIEPLTRNASYFGVIGNWEGENGIIPEMDRRKVVNVRKRYLPGPDHNTYQYGGSINQDYYAVDWGDALFVVLNVQTYSVPSMPANKIDRYLEVAAMEDWTLGSLQMEWLEKTLKQSHHAYKFIMIHHVVGGKGGNERESLYGRGGGRAHNVGEQAKVHQLMKDYGVQAFFYGHDHVFTDQVVDGIHYSLPGSAGIPVKFSKSWTGYEKFWKKAGFAMLSIDSDKAVVEFIDEQGQGFYQYELKPSKKSDLRAEVQNP